MIKKPVRTNHYALYNIEGFIVDVTPRPGSDRIKMDANDPELVAFLNKTGKYAAPYNYVKERRRPIEDGGYGSVAEQLDIMYHKGMAGWIGHVNRVKKRFPKHAAETRVVSRNNKRKH